MCILHLAPLGLSPPQPLQGAYTHRAFSADIASGLLTSLAADHAALGLPPPLADYDPQAST